MKCIIPSSPRLSQKEPSSFCDILSSLGSSTELQHLYSRYPQLRGQLREVYEATTELFQSTSKKHGFAKNRADRNRGKGRIRDKGIGQSYGGAWAQGEGLLPGIYQLRRLRHFDRKCGDGLNEFRELVLRLNDTWDPRPR